MGPGQTKGNLTYRAFLSVQLCVSIYLFIIGSRNFHCTIVMLYCVHADITAYQKIIQEIVLSLKNLKESKFLFVRPGHISSD